MCRIVLHEHVCSTECWWNESSPPHNHVRTKVPGPHVTNIPNRNLSGSYIINKRQQFEFFNAMDGYYLELPRDNIHRTLREHGHKTRNIGGDSIR